MILLLALINLRLVNHERRTALGFSLFSYLILLCRNCSYENSKIVFENTYRLNAATLSLKYSQVKNKINLENKKIQGRLLSQSLHYCFFSVCVMSRYMFNQIHICFRVLRFQLEKNFRMLHTFGFLIFWYRADDVHSFVIRCRRDEF